MRDVSNVLAFSIGNSLFMKKFLPDKEIVKKEQSRRKNNDAKGSNQGSDRIGGAIDLEKRVTGVQGQRVFGRTVTE